jgi:hypothetical protein
MPKKRRPDSDEHLTYFFRSMDPDDNVARAADELAQASQQDPRIQEALAAVQAFLAEPIGASYLEAAARLGNDFGDFGSFAREQAPLFGAAHIRAADTLTDGRGFERFGRRVRQGQILLDRVRLALIDTDAQFQGQVLTEAVRRAERSPAFRLRLREARTPGRLADPKQASPGRVRGALRRSVPREPGGRGRRDSGPSVGLNRWPVRPDPPHRRCGLAPTQLPARPPPAAATGASHAGLS